MTSTTETGVFIDNDNAKLALEWATRQYGPIDVGEGQQLGDEVLALAERYRKFLEDQRCKFAESQP